MAFASWKASMWLSPIAAFLLVFLVVGVQSDSPPEDTSGTAKDKLNNRKTNTNSSGRIITLAESIKSTMRSLEDPQADRRRKQYWRRTLKDIENMSFGKSKKEPYLGGWKLLLDEEEPENADNVGHETPNELANNVSTATEPVAEMNPGIEGRKKRGSSSVVKRPRFEGFPSWERMLQEWTEDVTEYLMEVEEESGRDYMLANYGRPPSNKVNGTTDDFEIEAQPRKVEPFVSDEEYDMQLESAPEAIHRDSQDGTRRKRLRVVPAPLKNGEPAVPETDLSDKSKRIDIVTTASLPWKTGTAVNPLLRAAYMVEGRKEAGGSVTLTIPWLERKGDQEKVYGAANIFDTPEAQETYIRTWLRESANMLEASQDLNIRFYTAWQNPAENSIYSMGDITALIPADEVDIVILEEPEHLNWYRAPGESWTKKFKHVVGILHTNYFQYALDQPAAIIRAPSMRLLCSWMCRAHCHRIVKLSGTIDKVAPDKELVENVHGVRGTFLEVGEEVRNRLQSSDAVEVFGAEAEPTIYFIGKMLWSKGLGSLMELLKYAEESANIKVKVDMYGGGPDKDAAEAKAKVLGLDMPFHGPLDHGEIDYTHKIFVNPSTSEVLCTTSAEALAMGKFVILPSHVSNDFFAQFPNCLSYASKEEFVGNLFYAMTHSPQPLSDEYLDALSWRAATKRLEAAGCIPLAEAEIMSQLESSKEGGVEIQLPPLVENEERRKQISATLRNTRQRYRQFRSRLSSEILENRVLPKKLRERLAADLEKQLDLDIDEVLESPKLRLQLSPAELDKRLLELYDTISASPSGDVMRVIGGGGLIGLQNFYMRRQALKRNGGGATNDFLPFDMEDHEEEGDRSTSQWIRWALRRNLLSEREIPEPPAPFGGKVRRTQALSSSTTTTSSSSSPHTHKKETPKMCAPTSWSAYPNPQLTTWSGLAPPFASRNLRSRTTSSLLI